MAHIFTKLSISSWQNVNCSKMSLTAIVRVALLLIASLTLYCSHVNAAGLRTNKTQDLEKLSVTNDDCLLSSQQQQRRLQTTTGSISGTFSLVKAGMPSSANINTIILAKFQSGATINLNQYNSPDGYSILFEATSTSHLEITTPLGTRIEGGAPYGLDVNMGAMFFPAQYLSTLGSKTITVTAYSGSTPIQLTYDFQLVNEPVSLITGTFALVKAGMSSTADFSSVLLGNYRTGSKINLDQFDSPNGYNIVFETSVNNFTKVDVKTPFGERTEGDAPYCLEPNIGNDFFSSSYLSTIGIKTITLNAHYGSSIMTVQYSFELERSTVPVPFPPPVPAPVPEPVPAPVPVPIPAPVPAPVSETVPEPVPVSVPVPFTEPVTVPPAPVPVPVSESVPAAVPAPVPVPVNDSVPSPVPSPVPVPFIEPVTVPIPEPVLLVPVPSQVPPSSSSSITQLLNRQWEITEYNAPIEARHEACFLMVGRVAVLVGGRGKRRADVYDPRTKTWKAGTYPPNEIQLHHFQCVAIGDKVWIVGAWTSGYPREESAPNIFVYDVASDTWETRPAMPSNRSRGSTAVIAIGNLLYVSHGNIGGHETDAHATSVAWLDVYDTVTDTWEVLPDAKFPRDHVGGAAVGLDGKKFCIAAGRDGGTAGWPDIAETECYDIPSRTWTVEANIAVPRGGSSYGQSCDGQLLIAGGEGDGNAYDEFDAFDGKIWTKLPSLQQKRHGSGLAVDCVCNAIYIASGNGSSGGGNEIYSVETIKFDDTMCT